MKALFFSVFLLMFVSCTKGQTTFKNISKKELKEVLRKGNVQLVDVRTKAEYDRGAIEGAILINFWSDDFLSKVALQFDKNKPIYLYCKIGRRSSRAAKVLAEKGFTKVFSLEGGYSNWIRN